MKDESTISIDRFGTKRYTLNGKAHRDDGPAVIFSAGNKWWFKHGTLHRLNGPAIETIDSERLWYIDGKFYLHYKHYLEDVRKLISDEAFLILVLTYGTE